MREEVDFFNQTSEQYLGEYAKMTPEGYSFRVRREKASFLIPEGKRGELALDVGCGPGIMIEALLKKGYQIEAVDAAQEMVKLALKNYKSNPSVKINIGDLYHLNSPDNSFDLVIAMGLLEYLANQDDAIKEIVRVLKHSGNAIITFPNKKSPWRIWNRVMLALFGTIIKNYKYAFNKKVHPLKHKEYTVDEALYLLKKNGLMAEKIIFYNFKIVPYPFDKLFFRFTIWQSRILEKLDKSFLKFIGTGFIVQARKNT